MHIVGCRVCAFPQTKMMNNSSLESCAKLNPVSQQRWRTRVKVRKTHEMSRLSAQNLRVRNIMDSRRVRDKKGDGVKAPEWHVCWDVKSKADRRNRFVDTNARWSSMISNPCSFMLICQKSVSSYCKVWNAWLTINGSFRDMWRRVPHILDHVMSITGFTRKNSSAIDRAFAKDGNYFIAEGNDHTADARDKVRSESFEMTINGFAYNLDEKRWCGDNQRSESSRFPRCSRVNDQRRIFFQRSTKKGFSMVKWQHSFAALSDRSYIFSKIDGNCNTQLISPVGVRASQNIIRGIMTQKSYGR